MATATMLVDGVPTEMVVTPITLLAHRGDVHIEPLGQVEIGPEQTLARSDRVSDEQWAALRADPDFLKLLRTVLRDLPDPLPAHPLARHGTGVRHVTGMILLLAELPPGATPFLRYPESFLHPRAQSCLADLFVLLSGAGKAPAA